MSKPGLPSGTRDFGPETMLRRKYVMGVIESVFQLYGFRPIETPALENLKTLQGKYGDEGDQLLFKILNNGDFLSKVDENILSEKESKKLIPHISDRGLRYDLTVPLARFVVMNRDKLPFPFRRYQIQPVWRADRPQKGRYREFWQCDADVVGSYSVLNEADLVKIYDDVFSRLSLPVVIRMNHRKLFDAFIPVLGSADVLLQFLQSIDKADKIGFDGVENELKEKGLSSAAALWKFMYDVNQLHSAHAKMDALRSYPGIDAELVGVAVKEIETILGLVKTVNQLQLDLTLARGLGYYTGCVFEVVPDAEKLSSQINIGSIGGGGRYDNLTGVFGLKDVPGVGISFGLDRVFDIMDAEGLFPGNSGNDVRILICAMDDSAISVAFKLADSLRDEGVPCEVYPGAVKLKKQLDYANTRKIPFAAILGENEVKNGNISLKNMETGEQKSYELADIHNHLHLWRF